MNVIKYQDHADVNRFKCIHCNQDCIEYDCPYCKYPNYWNDKE